jgi:glycosyltransferase involved in cell wall biosynthesis
MSSLLNQTLKPNEIVVVDGGSTDGTWERLQDGVIIFSNVGVTLKPVQEEGANIARGRNVAVENASNELIASIDGGCIARRDWLEKLMEREADVVSGNFIPLAGSFSEKVQAVFVSRSTATNPSSRSIMFHKSCWKKAGGYPENLYTGEDTLFNARLEEAGCKFKTADDAVVMWRMRSSLRKWFRQFYLYGKGDGRAGLKKTSYGKKVALLLLSFYAFTVVAAFFPSVLVFPFAASLLYGIYRSPSIYGLVGGLLLPFRLLAYTAGFHAGLLGKTK